MFAIITSKELSHRINHSFEKGAVFMKFKLRNGVEIPAIGLGTWKVPNDREVVDAVATALEIGYRHIDTAAAYGNEEGVGKGIRLSGIPREEIFVTTKLWNTDQGYESTEKAFYASLERLGLDYVDLYLIHWPKPLSAESWRKMEELYEAGKIRAIGVSNFHQHHLEDLFKTCKIKPMVNQIELHPRLQQNKLKEYCDQQGIVVTAWSPFMQGQVFQIEELKQLSQKIGKPISAIVSRWLIQRGIVSIPKSVKPERIRENFSVFDFELSPEDMALIASLDRNYRTGADPDNLNF